jgi:uncharacterized protein YjiS (DUF1127 family)
MTGTDDDDDDEEFNRMLHEYRTLTPEQQNLLVRSVIRRAKVYRARAIRELFRSLVDWFRRRAAIARLQRLDDRMLKDIGLYRGDIEAAVRGADRGPLSTRKSATVPACGLRPSARRAA